MPKPANRAELTEYHKLAAAYYNIFSMLLRQEFTAPLWRSFKANAATLPRFAGRQSVAGKLAKAAQAYAKLDEKSQLLELANLFARQFLAMGGQNSVALAQSVYTSPAQLLCQESFFAARAAYREQGLELTDGVELTEDHLAVILGFMGYHAERIAQMGPEGDIAAAIAAQRQYRAQLLSNWLGALVQKAQAFSASSFYTILLEYLQEFVEYDESESQSMPGGNG